jgi:hypothetical protein
MQIVLLVLSPSLLLFGLQKVDLLLLLVDLSVSLAVQGSCLKCTLDFHVVGFDHGASDVDSFALLEAEFAFFYFYGALVILGDFAHVRYLGSLLTSSLHPDSL